MIRNFNFKLITTLFLIILFLAMLIPVPVKADGMVNEYMNPKQFDEGYTEFTDLEIPNSGKTTGDLLIKILAVILTLIRIVAVGWAVIMGIAIATKYMSGDANIKAQIKVDMPTYIIGAVILFGISGILTLIQYFVEDKLT